MTATKTNWCVDIAIVGGGMVGGTLATALASTGAEVALVDRLTPSAQTDAAFDGRASAIALAPQKMLAAIGQGISVWDRLSAHATPILDIRVADGASRLFLHYDSEEVGTPALGYMLENRHIRTGLYDAIIAAPNIRLIAPAEVIDLVTETGRARLHLAGGDTIAASLVVGADGRSSGIRAKAGIGVDEWRYKQTGIVCTVRHEKPHHNVAHEHFLAAGPFAILPLSDNRSSLVWTERADLAPSIVALPDDEFMRELADRFGDFLGGLTREGPVWTYPLEMHLARRAVAPRVALVGDAAHGMHPIAGQGFNLGLRDVAALAEVVTDAARIGLDVGNSATLARYADWRRLDTLVMLGLTDSLNRLFSNEIAAVRVLRDLGLAAVNATGPAKRFFMRHAMGLTQGGSSDVPRLLRGEAL
jgi:2-octaprenyl-6-methoxyphenol hydroxylase